MSTTTYTRLNLGQAAKLKETIRQAIARLVLVVPMSRIGEVLGFNVQLANARTVGELKSLELAVKRFPTT